MSTVASRQSTKAPSILATMSKPHCPTLQVERFFRQCRMLLRHCCWLGRGLSVINWRRSSVVSFSHSASTFVYNTMGVTQRLSRASISAAAKTCLEQQRLYTVGPHILSNVFWSSSSLSHFYPVRSHYQSDKTKLMKFLQIR